MPRATAQRGVEIILSGLALFPKNLKAEFHGIRSVVEACSKKSRLQNPDGGNANGLCSGNGSPLMMRVVTTDGVAIYLLHRLE